MEGDKGGKNEKRKKFQRKILMNLRKEEHRRRKVGQVCEGDEMEGGTNVEREKNEEKLNGRGQSVKCWLLVTLWTESSNFRYM